MIYVELTKREIMIATRAEVRNLPGILFAGASPLLKPFMKKLEDFLPLEKRGQDESYILSNLYAYIDSVNADEKAIRIRSGKNIAEITREELGEMVGCKYPKSSHQSLNLPGLLFLQSSPSLQKCAISRVKSEHNLSIPDGRRALRYVFHSIVTAVDADKDRIRIALDPDRLQKKRQ